MGFWSGLGEGIVGAAEGTWEGAKSLAKGGYALATDPGARERAWEATKSAANAVADYGGDVYDDPAKLYRDARDGALAAYSAAENFVETADAEDWGKLVGAGAFEIGTALIPVGALAKASKLGKLAKAGDKLGDAARTLNKVEDVGDAVDNAADAARRLGKEKPGIQGCDDVSDAVAVGGEATEAGGRAGREASGQILKEAADPARGVMGAAKHSHPKEIAEMRRALEEAGVEIVERPGAMAYAPGLRKGEPGQFFIDPDASYSAWLHEYQHHLDDQAAGWGGMRQLYDNDLRWKREQKAYDKEIDLMRQQGHNDVARELEALKELERKRIYGELD